MQNIDDGKCVGAIIQLDAMHFQPEEQWYENDFMLMCLTQALHGILLLSFLDSSHPQLGRGIYNEAQTNR